MADFKMAAMRQWVSVVMVLTVVFSGGECFQWTDSLQDSAFVAPCVHGNLTLPWTFNLSSGQAVEDIKWYFHSQNGQQELIATYISGMFLATPSFSQRVRYLANGGLLLDHVTKTDSGNYSVEVLVREPEHSHTEYRRTAFVEVADGLRVREEPGAVYDPETDSWHMMLVCSTVISPDGSPGNILWETPSGVLPSTKYEDGHFYLQLQNPVKGGDYSCTLAPHSTASVCLPLASQQEAKITVDETKARVSLLEAENGHLKAEVSHTQSELNKTQTRLTNTESRLTSTESELAETRTELKETRTELTGTQSRLSQLEARFNSLELSRQVVISFYARMSSAQHTYYTNDRVLLSYVETNQGGAYNRTTSIFTAPVNGTYFFAATAGFGFSTHAAFYLVVDGTYMCYATADDVNSSDVSSTCAVTVRLTSGQTVWLLSPSATDFLSDMTTFTGFLIYADQ